MGTQLQHTSYKNKWIDSDSYTISSTPYQQSCRTPNWKMEELSYETALYIEYNGSWAEMWCILTRRMFTAFAKSKTTQPSSSTNRVNQATIEVLFVWFWYYNWLFRDDEAQRFPFVVFSSLLQFELLENQCNSKAVTLSFAALSRLLKSSTLPETPYFFNITACNQQYKMASAREEERSKWIKLVKKLGVRSVYVFIVYFAAYVSIIMLIFTFPFQMQDVSSKVNKNGNSQPNDAEMEVR